MALSNDGKVLLQTAIKGDIQNDPLVGWIRLKGIKTVSGTPGQAYTSTANQVSWGTENASTGLPLSGTEQYTITIDATTTYIEVQAIELIQDDNGSPGLKIAEISVTSAPFTISGLYTLQSVNINFATV